MLQEVSILLGTIFFIAALRFLQLVRRPNVVSTVKRTSPCKALVILGSGGHTAEMLRLLSGMTLSNYHPRIYVLAENDKMSLEKITKFELEAGSTRLDIRKIPRARKVLQSYFSSIFSTLYAIVFAIPLISTTLPELVLCNGPGTCIPVCFAAYVVKFLGLKSVKIVYVESFCRVESLSLSALMLYYFADLILVQWPQLQTKYPRTRYIGRLV